MTYKSCFVAIIFLSFLYLNSQEYPYFSLLQSEGGRLEIVLNIDKKGMSNAELYRINDNKTAVNIYEFVLPENRFTENAIPGACYYMKIYFEDGTDKETEKICFSSSDVFKNVNISMLLLSLIFIFSLLYPFLSKKNIFKNPGQKTFSMLQFFTTLLGENNNSIRIQTSVDSIWHPFFGSMIIFGDELIKTVGKGYVETVLPPEMKVFSESENVDRSMVSSPILPHFASFYTTVEKRDKFRSLVISIGEGFSFSDWDTYKGNDKRKIAVATTVSGITQETVCGRKSLVGVEPFLLFLYLKKTKENKSLDVSGIYLFLIILMVLVVAGSFIVTFSVYFPFLKKLMFLVN